MSVQLIDVWQNFVLPSMATILNTFHNLACVITCSYYFTTSFATKAMT